MSTRLCACITIEQIAKELNQVGFNRRGAQKRTVCYEAIEKSGLNNVHVSQQFQGLLTTIAYILTDNFERRMVEEKAKNGSKITRIKDYKVGIVPKEIIGDYVDIISGIITAIKPYLNRSIEFCDNAVWDEHIKKIAKENQYRLMNGGVKDADTQD